MLKFYFKVHIQTLVPAVEVIESRKPIRQTMIEMACYLKNELSAKTGIFEFESCFLLKNAIIFYHNFQELFLKLNLTPYQNGNA